MHVKAVVYSEDMIYIFYKLHRPEYLNTIGNVRIVSKLTLYMLLVIDVCERGYGIALRPLRPSHLSLRWKYISLDTFQSDEDDHFDIQISVTIKWSKGQSLDASRVSHLPFRVALPARDYVPVDTAP